MVSLSEGGREGGKEGGREGEREGRRERTSESRRSTFLPVILGITW